MKNWRTCNNRKLRGERGRRWTNELARAVGQTSEMRAEVIAKAIKEAGL